MAAADYRLCDVCGGKAFYDSNLNYAWGPPEHSGTPPFKFAGEPQYKDPAMNEEYGMRLDNLGDWAVLCTECAKTHRMQIVPIEPAKEPT